MDSSFETPMKRKYPQRNRKKVTYFEDFEMSMELTPKIKHAKLDETYDDNEKEYGDENEIGGETEEISEYEMLRLKNLEENRRVMMELGLLDPKKERQRKLKEKLPKPKPQNRPRIPRITEPTKRSLRLLRKTPDGRDIPIPDVFQESPTDVFESEAKTRIQEEVLPMNEDGTSSDFLDNLKSSLSQDSGTSSLESVESLIQSMRNLKFANIERITSTRIQSLCIHPMENKLLVVGGSKEGELGLWDVEEDKVVRFNPHLRAINCISVSEMDQSKLFTTSYDGTVRRADINKTVFDLVYQTDEKRNMCHITWHAQLDNNTLLVAHGSGEVGVVDLRSKCGQRWFHCHPRSVRTVQPHPVQPNYFLSSSGIGECKIWDLRGSKKHVDEFVGEFPLSKTKKGLTSAFFSPDGNKVVSTCNDDYIRIYDSSDFTKPKELHSMLHDNHTGRWLSVFKATWHPRSSDLIFVGSMLHPRRIQLYSGSGRLVKEVTDDNLSTVVPVIALHPTQAILVGGNSTGKGHVFTDPELLPRYIKEEDDTGSGNDSQYLDN